jgi:putative intracellular protease/amidase
MTQGHQPNAVHAAKEHVMRIAKNPGTSVAKQEEVLRPALESAPKKPASRLSAEGIKADGFAQPAKGQTLVSGTAPRGNWLFPVSAREVQQARASNNPGEIAKLLHTLAKDRSNLLLPNNATRLERMRELLGGLSADQIDRVRASHIAQYGSDPETNIRSWEFFQPLARLDDNMALEMVGVMNGPRLKETAATVAGLLDKARSGTLTAQDRATYYSTLPMVGLWDNPRREVPGGADLDSMERRILSNMWGEQRTGVSMDNALKLIEANMPPADLTPKAPREKSVAVIVSSAGAQWQELMDWVTVMHDKGYHVQVFTPDGRPAAFQHDSMCVCEDTAPVGHGCPPHLDPQGPTGQLARQVLANTAGAAQFNAKDFGAVYAAGGLGFNEDVVVANPVKGQDGKTRTELRNNPNIDAMMRAAVAERLPHISLCHGPTILASSKITIDGREEPLNRGIETASLPPFEGYVGLTRRKEAQFTYDVNTHDSMEEAGGHTHVKKDIINMSRVVQAHKDGMDIITGPGPQAARNLGYATLEAMERRWK